MARVNVDPDPRGGALPSDASCRDPSSSRPSLIDTDRPLPPDAFSVDDLRAALIATEAAAAAAPDRIRVVRAPGRVNLIGEYTDINDGHVLPAAIDLEIRIVFVPTDDRRVGLRLAASGECAAFDLAAIGPRQGAWIDYVAGTAWALAERGVAISGFRGIVASNLPIGAGLSSSAALEVAAALALVGGHRSLDPMALARIARHAENGYVGVGCGLMDQFAVTHGRRDAALLLDTRSLVFRPVPLPLSTHRLVVVDSGVPRRLDGSAYDTRRAECHRALTAIRAVEPAVRALRDVDPGLLDRVADRLDPVTLRRARHVVAEEARVIATEAAFREGDLAAVGRAWAASHASLRDDFEVSCPELDVLVEIASGTPGVVASRMTGAGFGGCTVNLVERDAVTRLAAAIERDYGTRAGRHARVIPVEPADGAGTLA